jgi:histone-lysine N-methyltransferase SETD3
MADMRSDYESICNIFPEFERFSYNDFKKFRLIVSSRLFGINIGKLRTDALVPLADMLNHSIPKQTSWFYSVPHDGFMIKSTTKI